MIKRLHHVQIIPKDLDKMVAFFTDILGLTNVWPVCPYENKSPMMDAITRAKGAHNRVVKIDVADSMLEFVKYIHPEGRQIKADWNDMGIRHICFEVDNLEEMYKTMKERGVKFLSPPVWNDVKGHPVEGSCAVYFWGPEGIMLEFFQPAK